MDVEPEICADEPVAVIDPQEASIISEQRWATAIESLTLPQVNHVAAAPTSVVILHFNRDQRAFDEVLLQSSVARRAEADGIEIKPAWAKGAKIFVAGVGPEHFSEVHIELRARYVVALEDDVPLIESIVGVLPSHLRPRLKPIEGIVSLPLHGDLSMFAEATDQGSSIASVASAESTLVSTITENVQSRHLRPLCPDGLRIRFTFLEYDPEANELPQSSRSV